MLNQSTFVFDSLQDAVLNDFYTKVDRSGGPRACWIWKGGSFTGDGYGQIKRGGKRYMTHRYSYLLHYGALPEGKSICHRCDTPACVNPRHLFAASHRENMQDRQRKGRGNMVRNQPITQKLTDDQVREIRELSAQGWAQSALSKRFGVRQPAISMIVRRLMRRKVV